MTFSMAKFNWTWKRKALIKIKKVSHLKLTKFR